MANPEHISKLREGIGSWNRWRRQNPDVEPHLRRASLRCANLSGANLSSADLSWANLGAANLRHACLVGSSLREANLRGADVSSADLSRADLRSAHLRGGNLSKAILRGARLLGARLIGSDLRNADLQGASLREATLVDANLEGANLTGCIVYGISAWNLRLERAIQSDLVITPAHESPIQVDNLEVAQFIYLLLNNEKIRGVIDTIGKKAVLILGRFTPERKDVLDAIRDALRHNGYLPILFDFEKPRTRDTHETIATLAGLSRFIIADITDPKSIPQELASVVPNLPSVPVQPLLQIGNDPWGMYDHIKRYHWVLPVVLYRNQKALMAEIEAKVIVPAEKKAKEQTRK